MLTCEFFLQDAETISNQMDADGLPELLPNAQLLVPPPPVQQMEEAWPHLTVDKVNKI